MTATAPWPLSRSGSTALDGPFEVPAAEIDREAARVPNESAGDPRRRRETSSGSRGGRCRAAWSVRPTAGVVIEQRVLPLDRVGCYVPGGRYPLPSSLLMTAIPARVAGVREIVVVCPKPDATVMLGGARGRHRPAAPARRRARHRGAGLRHRDHPARGQDCRARQRVRRRRRRRSSRRTARSTSSPDPARF